MKPAICIIMLALLAGCVSNPPEPKQPDKSHKVPVNKWIPEELRGKVHG